MPEAPGVAITGVGIVGAPGRGIAASRTALASGWCGLQTLEAPDLPLAASLPVGRVTAPLERAATRSAALGITAAIEALAMARLDRDDLTGCGISVGTCTAGMPESEAAFLSGGPQHVSEAYRQQPAHRVTAAIARRCRIGGPQATPVVACASAACVLIEACEWIRQGRCQRVLVVGADALCRVTMAGFTSLQVVDPDGCRPFTEDRRGMSLGEAGAALVLEDASAARRRGVSILALLAGWGQRNDAHHATAPEPTGRWLATAIDDCLRDAHRPPQAVAYVSAHGTGTRDNDRAEAQAIAATLGESVPVASCKRTYGHTMGAAAAVEAVISVLALKSRTCWPSAGLDPGVATVSGITLCRASLPLAGDAVLSTTLAFGGVNAALLFTAAGEAPCT
jgi:3-oxoacyl-[acyl-carrier-protein] synthase II